MAPFMSFLRPLSVAALTLVALLACGEGADPLAPLDTVTSIRVTPGAPTLFVGDSIRLVALPLAADGVPLQDRAVTWTSQDPARATVSATGMVHGLAAGALKVTATSEGVSVDVDVGVALIPAYGVMLDVEPRGMYEGTSRTAHAVVYDSLGRELPDRVLTWTSGDPAVATVSATGTLTALSEGQSLITASHGGLLASFTVTVHTTFVADLMFDTYTGVESGPRLFRADPYDQVATPIFLLAGTWQATASPDGSRIAFTCVYEPTESPTICVADRDGSNLHAITSGDDMLEDEPAWSPDGTRIAFRRWAQGGPPGQSNPTDVWVMQADGSGQQNLTADALVQSSPAWSPAPIGGAYRLVYSQESRDDDGYIVSHLLTIRADGTDRQPLTAGGAYTEKDPSWSPDGLQVVFVRSGGDYDGELIVRGVYSGEEHPLLVASLADEQRHPAWSPDGRHVAFTSAHESSPNGNFRRQIYTVRADGSGLRRRTTSDADKENVTWLQRP